MAKKTTRRKKKPSKDYRAIAAEKITRPSERNRSPHLLVYSRNKKGKTWLCATTPGVLVLDPEQGSDTLKQIDPQVWHVGSWEEIDALYKYLRLGDHDFKWLAVDGVTKLHSMALNYVRKEAEERDLDRRPGTTTQRDYGRAGELLKQLFVNLRAMEDIGVIYTTQERIVTVGDDEDDGEATTMHVPDLPQGVRGSLNGVVDLIGRLYVVRVKVKAKKGGKVREKEQRRLWIAPHERYDTGYRSDHRLPPMVKDPSVEKVVKLMEKGEEA